MKTKPQDILLNLFVFLNKRAHEQQQNLDELFICINKQIQIQLTEAGGCCSSPHTWWALWCCSAREICIHTSDTWSRARETSDICHRRPTSKTFFVPVKKQTDISRRCIVSLLQTRYRQLTKLCVVRGTWSKTSTRSSSPTSEVESVFQSIRNFLL